MNTDEPVVIVNERTREPLMTVQEYADLVRMHPLSIYRRIREGNQRGVVRIGRHIRIDASKALEMSQMHTRV